jgi:hypothetical protein
VRALLRFPLPQRPERCADFCRKELRLFPRGEVAALIHLAEIDQVWVGSLDPRPRRTPEFTGEDRECCGNSDFSLVGDARVLPVEPCGGSAGVREPIESDVVEDVVSYKLALGVSLKGVRDLLLPLFRQQTDLVKRAFQDVSPEEQRQFEDILKRIGKRAEALAREEREAIHHKDG